MICFEVWKAIERLILIYIITVGSLYSLLVSLFLRNIVVERKDKKPKSLLIRKGTSSCITK